MPHILCGVSELNVYDCVLVTAAEFTTAVTYYANQGLKSYTKNQQLTAFIHVKTGGPIL